ncbi:hypothetical protein AGABI2DRAFT_209944 [Agaricus bisporus var. bisporus H97]|uniref:hypothetical protein n=1 Tax=Agaricus bisporus var. bisporus (strain H97 / ATCC MYA-4626 / FGSC 10389) TaxID=936046 RepID=UPI00029F6FAE|nr:hypothetical protein AGABI2DRAFT_209944 [Agaricus bisporus var. bisporus H97]EKV44218.1 hypothetical protein AGABI2DRAFT_209944 [Agaricus bisporus var. bisporus H97]
MVWFQVFKDGPEYEARKRRKAFSPPNVSLKRLHDAVPHHLLEKSTLKSIYYIVVHVSITVFLYLSARRISPVLDTLAEVTAYPLVVNCLIRPLAWLFFWAWQGMFFAGLWTLGAGHDALSPKHWVNAVIGMTLHTFVLTPFYSWRATHRSHHKATNNLERDETFIPVTRRSLKLPDGRVAVRMDYAKILEETPAFTLFKLSIRQFLGFQLYLLHNRKGNPKYPPWTNHYDPNSLLFRPEEKHLIMISDVAILSMLSLLVYFARAFGWAPLWRYYLMPWLFAHNWMVMFTYLQHCDPSIPYYRKNEWTFARGALATVDRPIFGWVGRYVLHNVNTDHIAHHFFSSVPFYNLPKVTEAIKPVLGEYYNYDSTPVLYALWRSFTQCVFVEDEGDVIFFKNWYGEAILEPINKVN